MTVGSLFSGIGGIEMGLERTGGFKTVWQCEIDEYASAVLRKHWPQVPNLGDITKVDWNGIEKPDIICGGFPCQDISVAGKGKGIKEGTRSGLWFEFARAIRSLRPRYALIENVAAIATRGLDIVLADLAETGYDAEWLDLRASDVGAPHRRERLFIVAYPASGGCGAGSDNREGGHVLQVEVGQASEACPNRDGRFAGSVEDAETDASDTQSRGHGQGKQDKMVPSREGRMGLAGCFKSKTSDTGQKRIQGFVEGKIRKFPEFSWCENVRRVEELRGRPDIPEPLFRGSRHGVPCWIHRIKCLGNAVVPACAQVVGEAIIEMDKEAREGEVRG